MITGFNHSGFVVRDIDKMVAFYRDVLGLTVLREVDSKASPEGDHTGIPGARRRRRTRATLARAPLPRRRGTRRAAKAD